MKRSGKGFTIVELLVALALLGIASVLFLGAITSAISVKAINRQNAEAISISTGVMDELKATQKSWLTESGLVTHITGLGYTEQDGVYTNTQTDAKGVVYTVTIKLTSPSEGLDNLVEIEVTVKSERSSEHTLISRYAVK